MPAAAARRNMTRCIAKASGVRTANSTRFSPIQRAAAQPIRLEHQKGSRRSRIAEPDPAAAAGNCKIASPGDSRRMGHCDSSAHVGCETRAVAVDRRAAEAAAALLADSRPKSGKRSMAAWLLLGIVRLYTWYFSRRFWVAPASSIPRVRITRIKPSCCTGRGEDPLLAMKRLLRCRPFTTGGFDPVPETIRRPTCCAGWSLRGCRVWMERRSRWRWSMPRRTR